MPRKKQPVQRKRRQKTYREGELSSSASALKPKGAFRIFSNYKLFAIIGAVVLIGGLALSASRVGSGSSSTTGTGVRGSGVVRTTPNAEDATANAGTGNTKQYQTAPALIIDPSKTYTAVIKTDKGEVKVQLLANEAPATVNNFVFLANDHFYDGVSFFRVVTDTQGQIHIVQAGDPTGTGSGGPGYTLPQEPTDNETFGAGVLAMAKPNEAGAPNNGSQFFITTTDEPTFDGKYTVFGKVVDGLDVLKQLQPRDPQAQQDPPPGDRIQSIDIQSS